MCTNTKEAPTRRKHQLPEVLWHQPEGGSNPLWTPTHNLLASSYHPDMFSGTDLKETTIPYGTSPNCPEYKDESKLQPLLETASNHWLNHFAKSLSGSLLITTKTIARNCIKPLTQSLCQIIVGITANHCQDHCWKLHQTTDSVTLPNHCRITANHYQDHYWSLHHAKLYRTPTT